MTRVSWLGVGVASTKVVGVAPPTGVALPLDPTGVSSQRERVRLGVGVSPETGFFGVSSQALRGVSAVSRACPGVGVSSQRFFA